LTPDELEAAIAHELGHVWVFTHHPYLQTEELANQIAMRAVSRESLERVYGKVWERGGMKGDLVRFLGPAPETVQAEQGNSR
jgi:predicted Zn-dependent protease